MRLYHSTTEDAAALILREGFKNDEATYMNVQIWSGVWLSDRPLELNQGAALLSVNIPSELIVQYEWIQQGKPFREFLIPAEFLNKYSVNPWTDRSSANESMLEIAVNAAAAGHDLTGFEPVDATVGLPDGHEARCRDCDQTAWVGDGGLMYSLLGQECRQIDP